MSSEKRYCIQISGETFENGIFFIAGITSGGFQKKCGVIVERTPIINNAMSFPTKEHCQVLIGCLKVILKINNTLSVFEYAV